MSTTNQHATSTLSVQGMTCGSCEQRVYPTLLLSTASGAATGPGGAGSAKAGCSCRAA